MKPERNQVIDSVRSIPLEWARIYTVAPKREAPMRARSVAIAILGCFCLACATPYQPNALRGGFSETRLDENVFQVSFRGNGYTGKERARNFALLRSAELTLENGYSYFVILEADHYSKHSTYTTPSTSYTTASATWSGNTASASATTTTTGGQTYNISKPRTTNTIYLLKTKPEDGAFAYNAEFIRRSLREKYRIIDK